MHKIIVVCACVCVCMCEFCLDGGVIVLFYCVQQLMVHFLEIERVTQIQYD